MSGRPPIEPLAYTRAELSRELGADAAAIAASAYRWMILGRALDARMQGLQRQGRVGFYGAATGHEAINVALGLAVRPEDWIAPGLREQLAALVRGHDLTSYAHHLLADDLDPGRGRQMPCHPSASEVRYLSMSSVIGTQIGHAVGIGAALRARGAPGVSLAFFGDGATSSNDFHAGLNFAAVRNLPVLFGCANNQWAISIPVARQTGVSTLAAKAAAYGLPGRRVDGTDFVAVYRALTDELAAIRGGGGPRLVEFVVYRMTPHSSSDDPSRYQPSDWAARAAAHDPVGRLEECLLRNGWLDPAEIPKIREEADARVKAAVTTAEEAPPPALASLTEDVFEGSSPFAPEGAP